jgi:TIR domain
MARVSERNIYDFDVAVSFAGEDRELAEDVVGRLRAAGLTVFCDTDWTPAMWGGEPLEDLDQVYCSRARSVIIFVSYPYSKKMWAQCQRRSALARALEQAPSRVLLARLDSTRLKGLRPAAGYLDARRIGLGGVAQAAIANLTGSQGSTSAINHVPRTEMERQQVLQDRPLGWEYLYFAGQLRHERDRVEAKYRDHELRYARQTGPAVSHGDIGGYLARAGQEASHLSQTLSQMMDQEAQARAFGAPGSRATQIACFTWPNAGTASTNSSWTGQQVSVA